MNVEINALGVVLAAASSFVVGMIWYAKPLFGTTWMNMVGLKEADQKKGMGMAMAKSGLAALLTAYVLAHVAYLSNQFFGNSYAQDALQTAFWLGVGISATTLVVHDAFEQRDMKLTAINIGNQVVTLLAMGLVLGWIGL